MIIEIPDGDAGLVVKTLTSAKTRLVGIANLAYATDAERELARLELDACTRVITAIRSQLVASDD